MFRWLPILTGINLSQVNRRDWMKYGPEVERIKQKIRDARDNLQTGLTALNVIQG